MSIDVVDIKIKGTGGMLMNHHPVEPIEAIEKKTREEQAEYATYRIPDSGELFIPGINVRAALIQGGKYSKGKGRATLSKTVAACVMVSPEYLNLGTKDYVIDTRWARNPTTGGSILRHRPRLDDWEVSFRLEYENSLLSEKQVRKIVDDTGHLIGLLDYRPEKKGMFGRFMVTEWKTKKKKSK